MADQKEEDRKMTVDEILADMARQGCCSELSNLAKSPLAQMLGVEKGDIPEGPPAPNMPSAPVQAVQTPPQQGTSKTGKPAGDQLQKPSKKTGSNEDDTIDYKKMYSALKECGVSDNWPKEKKENCLAGLTRTCCDSMSQRGLKLCTKVAAVAKGSINASRAILHDEITREMGVEGLELAKEVPKEMRAMQSQMDAVFNKLAALDNKMEVLVEGTEHQVMVPKSILEKAVIEVYVDLDPFHNLKELQENTKHGKDLVERIMSDPIRFITMTAEERLGLIMSIMEG